MAEAIPAGSLFLARSLSGGFGDGRQAGCLGPVSVAQSGVDGWISANGVKED
jgi:hypothetical protein